MISEVRRQYGKAENESVARSTVRKNKYYINIDILRIVASFMVVVLHVAANKWHSTDVFSGDWAAMNFYDSAVRSCVPLFFMMSGMLFLNRDKMVPLSKLFKNNILKLVVVYIFWTLLYTVDTIGIEALLSSQEAWAKVVPLLVSSKYHLWFIPAMIGTYLLMPVVFAFKEYQNGKYIPYILVLFLVFAVILPTIIQIPIQPNYLVEILGKFRFELIGLSGYFLLGYYLSKRQYSRINKSILGILLVVVIGLATYINWAYSISVGERKSILYGNMILPVFLEATLIFIIFLKMKIEVSERSARIIKLISKCTLGVYVVHPFLIEHLRIWFKVSPVSFNPWISIPLISIYAFISSLIVALILSKIPVVNKWLI